MSNNDLADRVERIEEELGINEEAEGDVYPNSLSDTYAPYREVDIRGIEMYRDTDGDLWIARSNEGNVCLQHSEIERLNEATEEWL